MAGQISHTAADGVSTQTQCSTSKAIPDFLQESVDYVSIAEEKIKSAFKQNRWHPDQLYFGNLTTSKIRNILTLVNQIYNQVILLNGELPQNIMDDIRYMKIRFIYEAGRDTDVKNFCQKTGIIDAIDYIKNNRQYFLRYCKYMEALVAYHRYYGGRD